MTSQAQNKQKSKNWTGLKRSSFFNEVPGIPAGEAPRKRESQLYWINSTTGRDHSSECEGTGLC